MNTCMTVNGKIVDLRDMWLLKLIRARTTIYAQMAYGRAMPYVALFERAIDQKIAHEVSHIVKAER